MHWPFRAGPRNATTNEGAPPVHPLAVFVPRREAWTGAVVNTPGEANRSVIQDQTVHGFDERLPQSMIPCRPSREIVTYFLAPEPDVTAFMGDFAMSDEKSLAPHFAGIPPGRLSTVDDRRNVERPDYISYGDQVGELYGVAPYGLE